MIYDTCHHYYDRHGLSKKVYLQYLILVCVAMCSIVMSPCSCDLLMTSLHTQKFVPLYIMLVKVRD